MKKTIYAIATIIVCFLLAIPLVVAQQPSSVGSIERSPISDPGVTPDSFLWGLDKALEHLSLLLTLEKSEKARKGLEIARERLSEIKLMIEENKVSAATKAKDDHGKILLTVKENVERLERDNSLEEIEELIAIEKQVEEHDAAIEEVVGELNIKIKVKGEIPPTEQELIAALLNALPEQTGEIEIEIKTKKDSIKIKITQDTGKLEEEIEAEIEAIETENGLKKQEKALDAITDAEEELAELVAESAEDGFIPTPDVLDQFSLLLEQARTQFAAGNFREARTLAKQAERLLDNAEDNENEKSETEDEDREIEVEIEEGTAQVKIEIGNEKLKFDLATSELDAIIDEISARTGLSLEEIRAILQFEVEDLGEKSSNDDDDDGGDDDKTSANGGKIEKSSVSKSVEKGTDNSNKDVDVEKEDSSGDSDNSDSAESDDGGGDDSGGTNGNGGDDDD